MLTSAPIAVAASPRAKMKRNVSAVIVFIPFLQIAKIYTCSINFSVS
jgi:hypothetical protein